MILPAGDRTVSEVTPDQVFSVLEYAKVGRSPWKGQYKRQCFERHKKKNQQNIRYIYYPNTYTGKIHLIVVQYNINNIKKKIKPVAYN